MNYRPQFSSISLVLTWCPMAAPESHLGPHSTFSCPPTLLLTVSISQTFIVFNDLFEGRSSVILWDVPLLESEVFHMSRLGLWKTTEVQVILITSQKSICINVTYHCWCLDHLVEALFVRFDHGEVALLPPFPKVYPMGGSHSGQSALWGWMLRVLVEWGLTEIIQDSSQIFLFSPTYLFSNW